MAEQQNHALKQYSESLEKQNAALSNECNMLDQQLRLLGKQYQDLSALHTTCHQQIIRKEEELATVHQHYRKEDAELRMQIAHLEKAKREIISTKAPEVEGVSRQASPLHQSFGGFTSVLESRLANLNKGQSEVMEEHIQRVTGFREFLAGTLSELHSFKETHSSVRITPPKKHAMVQTEEIFDRSSPEIHQLMDLLRVQEEKVNELALELERRDDSQPNQSQGPKSDLIRIEVNDHQENLHLSAELHVIDDDSEEEVVDIFELEGQTVNRNTLSNQFITQVQNFEVRNRYPMEDPEVSQETIRHKQRGGLDRRRLSFFELLEELGAILSRLQQHRRSEDSQALLHIGKLLFSKAEELEHVNMTISQYLHNTDTPFRNDMPVQQPKRPVKVDDKWRTSLDLLSGSRSIQPGHYRQRTSSNHSKGFYGRQRESSSYERQSSNGASRMRWSGAIPSILKKPNLTDLSAKISDLKQAHEQRRRRHCLNNRM